MHMQNCENTIALAMRTAANMMALQMSFVLTCCLEMRAPPAPTGVEVLRVEVAVQEARAVPRWRGRTRAKSSLPKAWGARGSEPPGRASQRAPIEKHRGAEREREQHDHDSEWLDPGD